LYKIINYHISCLSTSSMMIWGHHKPPPPPIQNKRVQTFSISSMWHFCGTDADKNTFKPMKNLNRIFVNTKYCTIHWNKVTEMEKCTHQETSQKIEWKRGATEKQKCITNLVGQPQGNRSPERSSHRWKDTTFKNITQREVGCEGVVWIKLAQDNIQWRASVMNIWIRNREFTDKLLKEKPS
jgi:hypothetical protein